MPPDMPHYTEQHVLSCTLCPMPTHSLLLVAGLFLPIVVAVELSDWVVEEVGGAGS